MFAREKSTGLYEKLLAELQKFYLEQLRFFKRGAKQRRPEIGALAQEYIDELGLEGLQLLDVIVESKEKILWKWARPENYRVVAAEVLAVGLIEALGQHQPDPVQVGGVSIPVATAFIAKFLPDRKGGPDQVEIVNQTTLANLLR